MAISYYADLQAGSAIMEQVNGDAIYEGFEEYASLVGGTYTPETETHYGRMRWNNEEPQIDSAKTDLGSVVIIGIAGGHPEPPTTRKPS